MPVINWGETQVTTATQNMPQTQAEAGDEISLSEPSDQHVGPTPRKGEEF